MSLAIIRLTNGLDVMGTAIHVSENTIELQGALIVIYTDYEESGSVFFEKYCLYTTGFDVTFKTSNIAHVFSDLMPGIVKYYKRTYAKMRKKFEAAEARGFKIDKDETSLTDMFPEISKKVH